MSHYNVSNPALAGQRIESAKKEYERYILEYPNALIPKFEEELRALGYRFDIAMQVEGFLPKHKKTILPIAMRYYRESDMRNEKRFFLGLLNYKGFDEAVPLLLRDFYSGNPLCDRWVLGDSLYSIRSAKYAGDYLGIISNPRYGKDRQMVVLLVGKLRIEAAIPILIRLLDDEGVRGHAISALGNYKKEELRKEFERFLSYKNSYIRREALNALKKLDRYQAKNIE